MQVSSRFKKTALLASIVFGALLLALILFLTRPGSVTVSSESGSAIHIATEKGGTFKKIGESTATFKTRKVPSDVYIMATKDGKKTISSARLTRGSKNNITLSLAAQTTAQKIADGSYSSVILDGDYGQGIVPGDYTLVSFRTNRYEPSRAEFIRLPYIKKVVWYGMNDFIYSSFNDGVGRFIGGRPTFKEGVATNITSSKLDDEFAAFDEFVGSDIKLIDIAKATSKPLVLMSNSSVFLSEDMGSSLKSIINFDPINSTNYGLFSTDSSIYRFGGENPSAYAAESNGEKGSSEEHSGTLSQYDYTGKELAKIDIPDDTIRSVGSRGDKSYILTPNKLIVADKNGSKEQDLYFTLARDLTTYKDRVILLGDDGVWQIAEDGISIQLLYEFKDSGAGLAQSFSVSGNKLIFGTQPRVGDKNRDSSTFALEL